MSNSRIWFGPVNSNFHFEDCAYMLLSCKTGDENFGFFLENLIRKKKEDKIEGII
jgi:predicted CopG family antitoxin